MPKDERISVSLDELTLELLSQSAHRYDVSVGTRARHLICRALKQEMIDRKLSDSTLTEIIRVLEQEQK